MSFLIKLIYSFSLFFSFFFNSLAAKVLELNESKKIINISDYLRFYKDSNNTLTIDSILNFPDNYVFQADKISTISKKLSNSTYWLKFQITNKSNKSLIYILNISNIDIDHLSYFEVINDNLIKKVETGEMHDIKTREILNRNFLFKIESEPGMLKTCYLSLNISGHPLDIPISLKEREYFETIDNNSELIYWLIYGLLLFMLIFNLYLFRSTKDKVNLYYSLYVFFATIFLLQYDGYFYLFNPSEFIANIKWITPSMYLFFLITFTHSFTIQTNRLKWINKILGPLKYFAPIVSFCYFFKYPYSLIPDLTIPAIVLITLILVIGIAFASLKRDYLPSYLFLIAYIFMFSGIVVYELKELDIIPTSYLVENSVKLGLTLECILLTIAVLERFRINLENAKKTIEKNLKQIEIQNRELEFVNVELEKLSIVASEINNNVSIYDKTGRIEWCNGVFEQFYDLKLDDIIKNKKDKIEDIIPNIKIRKLFNQCIDRKQSVSSVIHMNIKLKKEHWVQTTLSPFILSGKVNKVIAVDSDITNLKKYEKNLELAKNKAEESDRLKTVFLGNMSHEIRTPLNGILGFSELLGKKGISDQRKENYLKIIMSNGNQLMRIIDDIVDISLIESNQLNINNEELSLKKLIHDITDLFEIVKTSLDKSHIKILKDVLINESQDKIISDVQRLKQVLSNLVRNSIKFTKEGFVKIYCFIEADKVVFSIEDSGIGIDPEKIDSVFERFRQGDETLSRRYGGTGLGLSISKGIMDKMNGKIWIDTNYENGCKVCFSVPYVRSKNNSDKKDNGSIKKPKNILKNKNILIVEDEKVSYDFLVEVLTPFDLKLSRALDGNQAIEMVKGDGFDMVLMDINLPELDGIKATREIRKFNRILPIIAQTAYAMESEKTAILASGCTDIITKPINPDNLLDMVLMHMPH